MLKNICFILPLLSINNRSKFLKTSCGRTSESIFCRSCRTSTTQLASASVSGILILSTKMNLENKLLIIIFSYCHLLQYDNHLISHLRRDISHEYMNEVNGNKPDL